MLQLVITEGMIDCFHACTMKRDYRQLFDDYLEFFKELTKTIKQFPGYGVGFGNVWYEPSAYFSVLDKRISYRPIDDGLEFDVEYKLSGIISRMKNAIIIKDWSDFYEEYTRFADDMIIRARKIGIFDLKIQLGALSYDSFKQRDNAIRINKQKTGKLFGELMQNVKFVGKLKGLEENLTLYRKKETINLETLVLHMNIYLTNHIGEQLSQFKEETNKKLGELGKQINGVKEEQIKRMENDQKNNIQVQLSEFKRDIYPKFERLGGQIKEGKEELGKRIENDQKVMQETILSKIAKLSDHSIQEHQDANTVISVSLEKLEELVNSNMGPKQGCSASNTEKLFKSMADQMREREEQLEKKLEDMEVREQLLDKKLDVLMELVRLGFDRKKKIAQLVVTEEMITCFHVCAEKGDFQQLFKDYQEFFKRLTENLKEVSFPDNQLCSVISRESKFLLDYMTECNPEAPEPTYNGNQMVEVAIPGFIQHLKQAISTKSWNGFYQQFRQTADIMITEARKQGSIDLSIEFQDKSYDNFALRDLAMRAGSEPPFGCVKDEEGKAV